MMFFLFCSVWHSKGWMEKRQLWFWILIWKHGGLGCSLWQFRTSSELSLMLWDRFTQKEESSSIKSIVWTQSFLFAAHVRSTKLNTADLLPAFVGNSWVWVLTRYPPPLPRAGSFRAEAMQTVMRVVTALMQQHERLSKPPSADSSPFCPQMYFL